MPTTSSGVGAMPRGVNARPPTANDVRTSDVRMTAARDWMYPFSTGRDV